MLEKIKKGIKSFLWQIQGRCYKCGGKVFIWDYRRWYCEECDALN